MPITKFVLLMFLTIILGLFLGVVFRPAEYRTLELKSKHNHIEPRPEFRDDFNGPKLDTDKWSTCYPLSYAFGTPCAHPENQELMYYTPDSVTLHGSNLILTAKRQAVAGYEYTSGLVQSHGRFDFTYGYVEASIKTPPGQGFWPTFWLMPSDGSWPPEIDIMEQIGSELTTTRMNLFPGPVGVFKQRKLTGIDYTTAPHTYAVDWQPGYLRWYVDGVQQYEITENVPAMPMYVILNLAVGGQLPGSPDATTKFPSTMHVDWVRVWEAKP